jgi:hypothetical protein
MKKNSNTLRISKRFYNFKYYLKSICEIQDINNTCIRLCFEGILKKNDIKCQENCFNKYVKVLNTVNKKIKDLGFDNQSMYAYKAYPEYTYWLALFLSGELGFIKTNTTGIKVVEDDKEFLLKYERG